jgi:hypothetical protein
MNLRNFLQGYAVAILAMLLPVWTQLSPHHQALYHSFLPMQTVVRGVLLNLAALTAFAALLFSRLQTYGARYSDLVWGLVTALVVPGALSDIAALLHIGVPYLFRELMFAGLVLVVLLSYRFQTQLYGRLIRAAQIGLLLVGFSAFWMVPQLLYLGFRTQPSDAALLETMKGHGPMSSPPAPKRMRIVWLLFDELSYDQTYPHRFPGLRLPNFDRLHDQSVTFTDVQPAGPDTERVVPSLLLGREIDGVHSDLNGIPSFRFAGQTKWHGWDPQATIFGDAHRLGWTNGVVGWYNPYCRILPGVLDSCFWRMGNGEWDGTSPANSSWKNAAVPLRNVWSSWEKQAAFSPEQKHTMDLAIVLDRALALIQDQRISFVFIHLPVPHPPGIYDRRTGRMRLTGSYVDNLALADRVLGKLLDAIATGPLAAQTSVILSSDHSWRTSLWRPTGYWTREDELASRFDPRPVLMVHSPGQHRSEDFADPTQALCVHEIVEAMLHGRNNPSATIAACEAGASRDGSHPLERTVPTQSPSAMRTNPSRSQ